MGQCCSDNPAKTETKVKQKVVEQQHSQEKEKTLVKTLTPVSTSAEKIGPNCPKSRHQQPKKNIHYIKSSASVEYHGGKQRKVPKSRCSIASTSSTERIAKRKLAHGMTPKVTIDFKKILENLREKQTMRNDVALIGTGGRNKSATVTVKSSSSPLHLKPAQSGRRRERSLEKSNQSQSKLSTRSVSNRNANSSSRHSDSKSKEKQNPRSSRKSSHHIVEDEV